MSKIYLGIGFIAGVSTVLLVSSIAGIPYKLANYENTIDYCTRPLDAPKNLQVSPYPTRYWHDAEGKKHLIIKLKKPALSGALDTSK